MSRQSSRMAAFIGIGFELIGLLLGAAFLGRFLDEKFGIQGLITAGMVIMALVGWLVHLILLLRRFESESTEQK